MRVETIEIFTFDELSPDAQKAAIRDFSDINVEYWCWYDCTYDDFERLCEIIGITVDQKEIYFSGFWSQGSGASFFGSYAYKSGCKKAIRDYAPQDSELHSIVDRLVMLQKPHFYQLTATISKLYGAGNYCHENTMSVDTEHCRGGEIDNSTEEETQEIMRDLARWLYASLEREYEWLTSAEAIRDTIQANEYEFTKEGKQHV